MRVVFCGTAPGTAVRVEAAREGVIVHVAVALDLALDLERRNRPPAREAAELVETLTVLWARGVGTDAA